MILGADQVNKILDTAALLVQALEGARQDTIAVELKFYDTDDFIEVEVDKVENGFVWYHAILMPAVRDARPITDISEYYFFC